MESRHCEAHFSLYFEAHSDLRSFTAKLTLVFTSELTLTSSTMLTLAFISKLTQKVTLAENHYNLRLLTSLCPCHSGLEFEGREAQFA